MSGCTNCRGDVNTHAHPMIVGTEDGAPARRVEFTIATLGRKAGDRAWVTGDQVPQIVTFGFAIEVG